MSLLKLSHALLVAGLSCSALAAAEDCDKKDNAQTYPTSAKVDYVIGCMASNGQTFEMLQKCSCSIDFIADAFSYDDYVRISTLMSLQQTTGAGRNAVYKSSNWSNQEVTKFREVQADSTLRCF